MNQKMGVQPDDVLRVIAALQAGNLRVWLDGGWGVDALLGEITRPHDDVDLVVELGCSLTCCIAYPTSGSRSQRINHRSVSL